MLITMIITISGMPGSGKTTVGKMLARRLGYRFYSMGDLRGKMAMERGMTIDQLNEVGRKEEWTDREVDEYQEMLGKEEDNFIVDGWLSWHFIPHSFKVLLKVSPEAGAERVFADQRPDERHVGSVEEMKAMLQKRFRESSARYREHYGISDILDESNYDLVVDTMKMGAEQVAEKVLAGLGRRGR
jgi:predicted cytidylate kinase